MDARKRQQNERKFGTWRELPSGGRLRVADKAAIHRVSAWATAQGLCLGQVKTDATSNDITAIPKLLDILALAGRIVTIDAMGCQTAMARHPPRQGRRRRPESQGQPDPPP